MSERLTRLLDAVLAVASEPELDDVLQNVVEAARDLAGARYAALGVVGEDSFLSRFVHTGMDEHAVARIGHLPEGHGILRLITEINEPLRLEDLSKHPSSVGFPEGHPPMRSFLGAPVHVRGRVYGNLYLTEKIDDDDFSQVDEELVVALAAVAGAAIANAHLFAEVQRLHVVDERERIGRDLHDTVIQRLFATGLTLSATARALADSDSEAADRVLVAVDDLDATIRQIRQVIFSLQPDASEGGVRSRVLHVLKELSPALGFDAALTLSGPIDLLSDRRLAENVEAVLREALTNVAKHARATRVSVTLTAATEALSLTVSDDGVGPAGHDTTGSGMGLANMRRRAEDLQGTFEITDADRGTTLTWHVPT